MKTRHQIAAYLGLLGMTTLIAILLSIRDKLLIIGPWVLGVLLAVIGLVMLYLVHKLYTKFRMNHLAMQAKQEELESQRQARRIESERWDVERAALLLNQHHQAARIYPDNKGYMPMLVNVTEAGYQYISLPHPAHQGRIVGQSQQQAIPEHAESLGLPTSIKYEQISSQIPRGHGLLGVSATSVETAEFHEFMTMLISGGSNSGKSNTVGIKINEAIENGRDVRLMVIDWHWRKSDSLYNKVKCYEPRFLRPVVTDEEDTLPALQWFYSEFKRRLAQGVTVQDQDILLVIDEVPGMMDAEDEDIPKMLKLIARKAGREARGYNMYAWFIVQQQIGLAWLRNVVHTVIAHKSGRMNEAMEACNQHKDIARDMENWPAGRVVVYGQNFQGVRVLQMPIFTPPSVEADRGSGAVYVKETETIEELQPLAPARSFWSPQENILQDGSQGDRGVQTGALPRDFDTERDTPANVRAFPQRASNQLVEQSDATTEDGPKVYRLSEAEIQQFIVAYKVSGSIDKSLSAIGRGGWYKKHASEIVRAYGLRQNA